LGGLFLTPFNASMLIVWLQGGRWLKARWLRPVAGGVKIIKPGGVIRARLPKLDAAVLSLMATGVAGLAAAISLAAIEPSVGWVLKVVTAVFLAGAGVYAGVWLRIRSGIYDLVINPAAQTVKLPPTCGRPQPLTVAMADLAGLWMETFEYRTTKGGVTCNYKPRLRFRENKLPGQTLAVWSERSKADDFTDWRRPKLGL